MVEATGMNEVTQGGWEDMVLEGGDEHAEYYCVREGREGGPPVRL